MRLLNCTKNRTPCHGVVATMHAQYIVLLYLVLVVNSTQFQILLVMTSAILIDKGQRSGPYFSGRHCMINVH